MKKNVFEYIKSHPHSSANITAQSLNLPSLDVLRAIQALEKESYLKLDPPIPLSLSNDNSVYYSATGKPYPNEEAND